ncbi:hypothetical protein H6F93_12175 [Leptolyngbya sp. FACHB-671]|uniref:hypothetical protein n=1 Tax=Leptolyngbya sp. FACHB-671 TaxID=2692812 RepID=UPI0016898195|nr:hypothetical protein [Leptolyngbya sp. FACHB-671]MBD2068269.1 hypothetical protein [Leptolyngbya sp. FACHB-671]
MLGLDIIKHSRAYQEAVQEGRQEGRQEIVENLLKARFGSLDKELTSVVQVVINLLPEKFTPLLVQLSREELLNRFGRKP